jgi:multidrug transporter EmrE-like cation transporter
MPAYVWLLISILATGAGDAAAKLWAAGDGRWLVPCVLAYLVSTLTFLPVMRDHGLIWASMVWSLGSILAYVVIGLWFGERLPPVQWVGVALGAVAVALLALPSNA